MKNRQVMAILAVVFLMFLIAGCVPGDGKSKLSDPAGFFSGIWHGWIAPVTLV